MKSMILLFSLLSFTPAFAADLEREHVIGNEGDFLILSDVEAPEFEVFLSYTGRWVNHCGIALQTHYFGVGAEDLNQALEIQSSGEVLIENRRLVSRLSPDIYTYGHYFTIRTKSGLPLRDVIRALDTRRRAEVIVTVLPCP